MGHPGKTARLLRANPPLPGKINEVRVTLASALSDVPHVFVHWPGDLADSHHAAGAAVMQAVLDAQVAALAHGNAPTLGDDANADPTLKGGGTF